MTMTSSSTILQQVHKFVQGVSKGDVKGRELVATATVLLRSLPATRAAIFEYFSTVYDDTLRHLLDTNEDSLDNDQYETIHDIHKSLLDFLHVNPTAWSPIISTWSIELLGSLSSRYSGQYMRRKNLQPSTASLHNILNMWMGCQAVKSLIEITSECITAMRGDSTDHCVDTLLETSVKHSPHFDWVVAHIGLCFPHTIINRVLMSGLRDFYHHGGNQADITVVTEENMPKFASVVNILGHLASQHGWEIKSALICLFQESLNEDVTELYHQVVPFLLRLASMSPMLLKTITADFIALMTVDVLNCLCEQSIHWFEKGEEDNEGLLNLLVHLCTSSDTNSLRLLNLLLDTAFPTDNTLGKSLKPEVIQTSRRVLESLLQELCKSVQSMSQSVTPDIPFLYGLLPHAPPLTRALCQARGEKHLWMFRLVKCLTLSSSEGQAAKILCDLLIYSTDNKQLPFVISLQEELQIRFPDILSHTVQDLIYAVSTEDIHKVSSSNREQYRLRVLNNLLQLVQLESKELRKTTRCTFTKELSNHLDALTNLLSHPDPWGHSGPTVQILAQIRLPETLPVLKVVKLCHVLVAYCFRILTVSAPEKFVLCESCKVCMERVCKYPTAQKTLLRLLLETAVTKENGYVLGAKLSPEEQLQIESTTSTKHSLLQANSAIGSLGRTQFGGVIGQGPRLTNTRTDLMEEHMNYNKKMYIQILQTVATQGTVVNKDKTPRDTTLSTALPTSHISRVMALLLIEIVSPDVMYNGIPWPEEESMKVTIERDLLMRKKFEECPILWDIMDYLAQAPGAMCFCSVILRGLMATLIYHWDACRHKTTQESPWQLLATCSLIRYMRQGHFLPPPLSYSGEILDQITPYEVFLVLLNLWRYMKENPPVPEERNWSENSIDPKYLEALRPIFHSNIHKLGHMYARFFTK